MQPNHNKLVVAVLCFQIMIILGANDCCKALRASCRLSQQPYCRSATSVYSAPLFQILVELTFFNSLRHKDNETVI